MNDNSPQFQMDPDGSWILAKIDDEGNLIGISCDSQGTITIHTPNLSLSGEKVALGIGRKEDE